MTWRAAALALVVLLSGCSFGGRGATAGSPAAGASASASPSPPPAAPAVAVVNWEQQGNAYTLSLVSATGKVVASAHASGTELPQCGPVQAGILSPPPVSTSNSRVYYLDSGTIKWLQEDGSTGTAFGPTPTGSSTVIGFAVSPDDLEIAINTIDYSRVPPSQKLTVTKMGASTQGSTIYSARSSKEGDTSVLWPVGWHAGNLVLGYHPSSCTQGGGPGQAEATAYHVVDPQNASRVATIGSDEYGKGCGLMGYPGQAGIPCANFGDGNTQILSWSGQRTAQFGTGFPGALSPDGSSYVGTVNGGDSSAMSVSHTGGGPTRLQGAQSGWVTWIDNDHFALQSWNGANQPVQIFSKDGSMVGTSAAIGQPLARIPPDF